MSEAAASQRPLAGLRIVDAVQGPLASLTRYLAELGATVERIVPTDGDQVADAAANAGKWRLPTDLGDAQVREAIAGAHAIVADALFGLDLTSLQATRPALVTMTVSDFGSDTSLSDWQATGPILHALSGELSRSGIRGRPPLLPPGDLAYQCAASQAAYVLVEAVYRALRTGQGDHLDFSALDGAVQALDPGYGINGSATMGRPAHLLSRDRPAPGFQYPILACADGHVRICLLAKRQWQGMFRWMGEPEAFASPDFEKISARSNSPELLPAIAAFFAPQTRAELERDAQRHGVPLAALLTFEDCIATDQMREREAFAGVELENGEMLLLPNGSIVVDGARMSPRPQARHDLAWPPAVAATATPFEGLRVLDLGIIVVGAEQSRLLGDGGADVAKVETRAYPDGNRQSYLSYGLSVSFAAGHRNKRSLGLNLRDPAGRALFLELVAQADVVMSNFKPGTLEALGIAYADLVTINPRIVMAESSAFGATGPWSSRMGYGPLVRAATGLTSAWRYPDDPQGYCDSVTVYPDHVAARIGAMSVVALLIRRLRTGRGGTASIAQSEVMLAHFAADVARAAKRLPVAETDAPWGVFRAAGDDEWCVITVRDDRDWQALCGLIAVPGLDGDASLQDRRANRAAIDAAVGEWTSLRSSAEVAETLQPHGIPAAPMLRVADLPGFAYYRERKFFRVETHPYLQEDVIAERWPVRRSSDTVTPSRPAPLAGEHSFAVIGDWLGPRDVEALAAAGILEPLADQVRVAAEAGARAGAASS